MLTDQADRCHARPAEDEHRRVHRRLPRIIRPNISEEMAQSDGEGQIQGRFDSDELERAVKKVITKQRLQDTELLKDTADASCKV
jgi:hypothetical protein